jgi:hypothetical protein
MRTCSLAITERERLLPTLVSETHLPGESLRGFRSRVGNEEQRRFDDTLRAGEGVSLAA